MASPIIHAAVPAELADWISRRDQLRGQTRPLAKAAISELWALREITSAELARTRWSLSELQLLAQATMDAPAGPGVASTVGAMFGAVFDARRAGDIPDDDITAALLDKLASLGPAADMAVEYAVATWWDEHRDHTVTGWAEVGVRVSGD